MCTHLQKIYNSYCRSSIYVPCGVCPACQMEKANGRLRRIKNSLSSGEVVLFVTLTYAPKFLPYIRPSELKEKMAFLSVYRDYDVRKVRKSADYGQVYQVYKRDDPICVYDCFKEKIYYDGKRLPRARGSRHKIGVLYFKDLQDFCKRLERNLFRHYSISGSSYKMFKVSEYGETFYRPHFHLGIHVKKEDLAKFYSAIRESWPFDNQGLERQIEVARSAASYISRYVNRGADFPSFFENKCFRPKSSFSKSYGLSHPALSLPSLLQAADRGLASFTAEVCRDGKTSSVDLLYPKYLLNRYFPKFKGYSRLSFAELLQLVRYPLSIYTVGERLGYTIDYESGRNDYDIFLRILRLRFFRFCQESGLAGRLDELMFYFAFYWYKVHKVRSSCVYRKSLESVSNSVELLEQYYNLDEVRASAISTDLIDLIQKYSFVSDPNLFHTNISRSMYLENEFLRHKKRKKVTNAAYRRLGMKI